MEYRSPHRNVWPRPKTRPNIPSLALRGGPHAGAPRGDESAPGRIDTGERVPRGRQRAAQRHGLNSARDTLHGRVVKRRSVAIRSSMDETHGRQPATPWTKMRSRAVFQYLPQGRQRAAQRRGLGSARDRLHGRAVARRWIVEMAPGVGRNTVVDGRATGPDPRRKQACARSPKSARARENANDYFRSRDGTGRNRSHRPCSQRSASRPAYLWAVAIKPRSPLYDLG